MYIIKLCTLIPIMFRAIHQSRYWSNYCIVAWELWVPCFMESLHSISWVHNSTILHLDNKMNLYRILFLHHIAIYEYFGLYSNLKQIWNINIIKHYITPLFRLERPIILPQKCFYRLDTHLRVIGGLLESSCMKCWSDTRLSVQKIHK